MSAHSIRPQTIIADLPEEEIELSLEELTVIVGGMTKTSTTSCEDDLKQTGHSDCD